MVMEVPASCTCVMHILGSVYKDFSIHLKASLYSSIAIIQSFALVVQCQQINQLEKLRFIVTISLMHVNLLYQLTL